MTTTGPDADEALFAEFGLASVRLALVALRVPCYAGTVSDDGEQATSWLGGLPKVGRGFEWPMSATGTPLSLVAQLACQDMGMDRSGALLFFYDHHERPTGWSPKDAGHFAVIRQDTERSLLDSDLPTVVTKRLFGLARRDVRPNVWPRLRVHLSPAFSYPNLDDALRIAERFHDDVRSRYLEFVREQGRPPVQVGGFARATELSDMDVKEIGAKRLGLAPSELGLLLKLESTGAMSWGDMARLCFLIPNRDLKEGRFERVWLLQVP
jgi:uncharacterized protein YwqG